MSQVVPNKEKQLSVYFRLTFCFVIFNISMEL